MAASVKDSTIRQEVWEGSIPIAFFLSPTDFASLTKPEPYFLNVSRECYLPLVTDAVKEYFSSFAPSVGEQQIWFEAKGIPLKWHYPAGVLYDLYGEEKLPWEVTVHFTGYPLDKLLADPAPNVIRSHWMNVLKEACYLKHGDLKKINALSLSESNDIWESFRTLALQINLKPFGG